MFYMCPTRLLHLTFRKQGGNIHILGAYAPHSGLDFEEVKVPFWDSLEEHIAKIPRPEPLYLVGDFNVRFQAQHRNDEGVTGPFTSFTYGKGTRYIDHNAQSNRSLCVRTMQLLGMVEGSFLDHPPALYIISPTRTRQPHRRIGRSLYLTQYHYSSSTHSYTTGWIQIRTSALATASKVRSFLDLLPRRRPHRR